MTEASSGSPALKARLLADLVQAMASGHLLQASTVAVLVGRNAYDIVNQSATAGQGRAASADERLQRHLRNVVTVVSVAHRHFGTVPEAVQWYRSGEGQHTPEAMTATGRLEDVYRLLLRTPAGGA
jgi:hypothetical protein